MLGRCPLSTYRLPANSAPFFIHVKMFVYKKADLKAFMLTWDYTPLPPSLRGRGNPPCFQKRHPRKNQGPRASLGFPQNFKVHRHLAELYSKTPFDRGIQGEKKNALSGSTINKSIIYLYLLIKLINGERVVARTCSCSKSRFALNRGAVNRGSIVCKDIIIII